MTNNQLPRTRIKRIAPVYLKGIYPVCKYLIPT